MIAKLNTFRKSTQAHMSTVIKGVMNDLYVTSTVVYKLLILIHIVYPGATTAHTKTLRNHIRVMYINV